MASDAGDLVLAEAERDVVATDAAAFARAVADPAARARYERLAASAATGSVPQELVGPLETMVELLFEKGRPGNRAVLQSVYARTPLGRQQAAAAHDVNAALKTLSGQRIEQLRLSTGPAAHTLVIESDRCRLTIELDRHGARVASLETG